MDITITATEANRKFSEMLRGVRGGKRYRITSRGEVVAELRAVSGDTDRERAQRQQAMEKLLQHLESQPAMNLPHITRDEMHER